MQRPIDGKTLLALERGQRLSPIEDSKFFVFSVSHWLKEINSKMESQEIRLLNNV